MVDSLWSLMEQTYRANGASNNGAQLMIRSDALDYMLKHYSENEIRDMLLNDFDKYHRLALSQRK